MSPDPAEPDHDPHAKIVSMANQIATFFESQPEPDRVRGVAEHIGAFWEPRMRRQLAAALAGGAALHPLVRAAFPRADAA